MMNERQRLETLRQDLLRKQQLIAQRQQELQQLQIQHQQEWGNLVILANRNAAQLDLIESLLTQPDSETQSALEHGAGSND